MSSALTALEIGCAKPGCHWKGPPRDAPGHPCPTPDRDANADAASGLNPAEEDAIVVPDGQRPVEAELAGHPFAGIIDADGKPIANEEADRDLPFWVVWADQAEFRLLATLNDEADAVTLAQKLGEELDRGEITVRLRPPDPAPAAEAAIAHDAAPATLEDVELWLAAHGHYDAEGVPQDEKTAELDARLGELMEADEAGPAEPEPELPPAEPEPAGRDATSGLSAPLRPTVIVIAEALRSQTGLKDARWVVVHEFEGYEADLLGRGKTKAEANEIRDRILHQGKIDTDELTVYKTQSLLEQAEKIIAWEAQTATAPDSSPEAAKPEPAPAPKTDPAAERKGSLFDGSDYDREDLALPKVDGHGIDRIAIAFSGEIMLDRSDPAHVALFRRLALFKSVELWVSATAKGQTTSGATNRDGDLDVVVGKRSLKIETVRIIPPEGLEEAAAELAAQAREAAEQTDN